MSSTGATDDALKYLNFTGGFPTHKDLAPCIIFIIGYAFTFPVLVYRLARKQDRTWTLTRPIIFYALRVPSLIIRAIMAETTYGVGLLIAELILISIGYFFLIYPVIVLWRRHVGAHLGGKRHPLLFRVTSQVASVLLAFAILLSAIAGGLTNSALGPSSGRHAARALRQASYVVSLGIVTILLVGIIWSHFHFGLPVYQSAYLFTLAAALLIVSTFRVAQAFELDPHAASRTLAAFWTLQILPEFVVWIMMISISLPTVFSDTERERKTQRTKGQEEEGVDLEGQGRGGGAGRQLKNRPWYMRGLVTRHFGKSRYYS